MDYRGEYGGTYENLMRGMNHFVKEGEILESLERSLSNFLKNSVSNELDIKDDRIGKIFLSRFNARHLGQSFFYIEFNPSVFEKIRYVQKPIAQGDMLEKKITFFQTDKYEDPPYLKEIIIPHLKKIFTDFNYEINP